MNSDIKELIHFSKRKLIKIILSQAELIESQSRLSAIQQRQLENQDELIKTQQKQIDNLELLVKTLQTEIRALQKNSSNSSKPPSSDMGDSFKKNQSLRQKSDKKSGGQNGHIGSNRNQTDTPDKIIICRPNKCECCGKDLSKQKGKVISKRQEVDIPPIKPESIEYQQEEIKCTCGHCNKGEFPKHIASPMQIGQNLKSFIVYLNISHYIPFKRLKQLIKDLLNIPVS